MASNKISNIVQYNNVLPPKEEHILAVEKVLKVGQPTSLATILLRSRISKTQALCAIDALMHSGKVMRIGKSHTFVLIDINKD